MGFIEPKIKVFIKVDRVEKLALLKNDGELLAHKFLNERIVLSLYSYHNIFVKVSQTYPDFVIVQIIPTNNARDLFRYLSRGLN